MGLTDILCLAVFIAFVALIGVIYKYGSKLVLLCDLEEMTNVKNERICLLNRQIEAQRQQLHIRDQQIKLLEDRIKVLETPTKKPKENAQQ